MPRIWRPSVPRPTLLLFAVFTAHPVLGQEQQLDARVLYQRVHEDVEKAKAMHEERSYSSALFHLTRALAGSKKLVKEYPKSMEAAEARPFMGTIASVIGEMDAAAAKMARVRCGCVYVEPKRRQKAEEDGKFLERMMGKQAEIDESLDRGHWRLAARKCKEIERAITAFTQANPGSTAFYALMVIMDEVTDREIEAEANRQAYEETHAQSAAQKRELLRGKLAKRLAEMKSAGSGPLGPIRIRTGARTQDPVTQPRAAPSPEEMAKKRALIRAKLAARKESGARVAPPAPLTWPPRGPSERKAGSGAGAPLTVRGAR